MLYLTVQLKYTIYCVGKQKSKYESSVILL